LHDAGFELISEGFRNHWNANEEQALAATEYGRGIVKR
jgi:hypothetical protein